MKKKILTLPVFMSIVALSACWDAQARQANEPVYEPIQISTNITAAEAEDLAIELIGGGELVSLALKEHNENQVFEVVVDFEEYLYDVLVDLQTGDVISLVATSLLEDEELTEDEAVALALEYLESIGVDDAELEYAYLDEEDGVQVWSIEFSGDGREYEFYVDVLTGEFLKSPDAYDSLANATDTEETGDTTTQPPATQAQAEAPTTQPLAPISQQAPVAPSPAPANQQNNTTISRDQAAEIALAFVPGSLIEVDNDFEHGRAVWYVAIRSGGRIHEVYVDQQTGEIVYHESEIDD